MQLRSICNSLSFIFPRPVSYTHLDVYKRQGLDDARINEVLQIVQLTNTGKKRAGQFSLGMKQRLGIAIALLNSPPKMS